MLSYTKQTNVSSENMYDTLLPLFNGGQPYVQPIDVHVKANQPLQVPDQSIDEHIDDIDMDDAVDEKMIAYLKG